MNPTKTLASLAFAASMLFAGACAQDLAQEKPGSTLTHLSNGPDLPEECNVCWDDFQDCFAAGNDLGQCGADITVCADECQAPPPPSDCLHCAAGFDACVTAAGAGADPAGNADGDAAADCAAGFEGCLLACETEDQCANDPISCQPCGLPTGDPGDNGQQPDDSGQGTCDPTPPPSDCEQCDHDFNNCVNDLWLDPNGTDDEGQGVLEICEELSQGCRDQCEPNSVPPIEECDLLWQACTFGLDGGANGESCEAYEEKCDPNHP